MINSKPHASSYVVELIVDHLVLDEPLLERLAERGLYAEGAEGMPLFFDGNGPPAKRFIIIRDLKTIEGPKPGEDGIRHVAGLFKEIQLALYARAWELAHQAIASLASVFQKWAMIRNILLNSIRVLLFLRKAEQSELERFTPKPFPYTNRRNNTRE